MKQRTTLTEKKLAANRLNAEKSTGPRTERGKRNSKFNAVKFGLFAEHVVIPSCDGDPYEDFEDAEGQFAKLLDALQEEYEPEGPSEVFWVTQIAECMWKQRRVSRSERGMVEATKKMHSSKADTLLRDRLVDAFEVLDNALKEIETTQSLSRKTYYQALSYVELARTGVFKPHRPAAIDASTPSEVPIDAQFVASLEEAKVKVSRVVSDTFEKMERTDYYAARALPWEDDMTQILRCDKELRRKFDWALERLLESQRRRRRSQASVGDPVLNDQAAENRVSAKRSQQVVWHE